MIDGNERFLLYELRLLEQRRIHDNESLTLAVERTTSDISDIATHLVIVEGRKLKRVMPATPHIIR